MTKPFILVTDGMNSTIFENLKNESAFEVHPKAKLTQEEVKPLLPKVNGLVIRSATKPKQEFIDQCPNLKYIIRAGEGTDNIDKKYCEEKGIKVSNTPGANNNSAAEHAIALMMTVLRKTASANQSMHTNAWNKSQFTGNELWKKKVGIIGFGRIGQLVCKRLAGFDNEVSFFDPYCQSNPFDYATQVQDINEIFKTCDIITIHVPLIDSTKNLINKETINMMSQDTIIINASRGGIVNEPDLIEALNTNKIRGAALDVFASEPLEDNSALCGTKNLTMTPHLGGSTQEAQFRVAEMAHQQLKEFFLNDNHLNGVKA